MFTDFQRLGEYNVYSYVDEFNRRMVLKIEEYTHVSVAAVNTPGLTQLTLMRQMRRSNHLVSLLHQRVADRADDQCPVWVPVKLKTTGGHPWAEIYLAWMDQDDRQRHREGTPAALAPGFRNYFAQLDVRTSSFLILAPFVPNVVTFKRQGKTEPRPFQNARVARLQHEAPWAELGRIVAVDLFTSNDDRMHTDDAKGAFRINGTNVFADDLGFIGGLDCFHTKAASPTVNLYSDVPVDQHWVGRRLGNMSSKFKKATVFWQAASLEVVEDLFYHLGADGLQLADKMKYAKAFYGGVVEGRARLAKHAAVLAKEFAQGGVNGHGVKLPAQEPIQLKHRLKAIGL